jgi:hypothetical protein
MRYYPDHAETCQSGRDFLIVVYYDYSSGIDGLYEIIENQQLQVVTSRVAKSGNAKNNRRKQILPV